MFFSGGYSGFIEINLRILFVNVPFWIDIHLPELLKLSRLAFLYIFLQLVGVIWAFLLDASCSAILTLVRMLMPSEQAPPSLSTLVATFYLYYASFRLIAKFGQNATLIGWQSLEDFPQARSVLVRTTSLWPVFLSILFSALAAVCLLLFFIYSL